MFANLVESNVKRKRSLGQGLLSLSVHGVLTLVAVMATQGVAATVTRSPVDTTLVYIQPLEPTQPRRSASLPPSGAGIAASPLPKSFQVGQPPIDVPDEMPPITDDEQPFDPSAYNSVGEKGGRNSGLHGGIGDRGDGASSGKGDGGSVYAGGDLDDPVQQISIPKPRYPPALQSAAIQGLVELEYVVDTTGRAEPSSFQILTSSRPEFVNPAKEAILKGIFKPAKLRGQPVRQLVRQRVLFKVDQ